MTPAPGDTGSLVFRRTALDGVTALRVEVSRTDPGEALLELWADAPGAGILLASVPVPATGGRYAWTTVEVPLAQRLDGVRDLHLVLTGEQRLAAFTLTG
jgi:beta-glucosidase